MRRQVFKTNGSFSEVHASGQKTEHTILQYVECTAVSVWRSMRIEGTLAVQY